MTDPAGESATCPTCGWVSDKRHFVRDLELHAAEKHGPFEATPFTMEPSGPSEQNLAFQARRRAEGSLWFRALTLDEVNALPKERTCVRAWGHMFTWREFHHDMEKVVAWCEARNAQGVTWYYATPEAPANVRSPK